MNQSELKRVLLFLLETSQNHERLLRELSAGHRALHDAAIPPNPLGVWEKYEQEVVELLRADRLASEQSLQRFDALIRQVQQWSEDDS